MTNIGWPAPSVRPRGSAGCHLTTIPESSASDIGPRSACERDRVGNHLVAAYPNRAVANVPYCGTYGKAKLPKAGNRNFDDGPLSYRSRHIVHTIRNALNARTWSLSERTWLNQPASLNDDDDAVIPCLIQGAVRERVDLS